MDIFVERVWAGQPTVPGQRRCREGDNNPATPARQMCSPSLSLRVGSSVTLGYDPIPANATDIKTKWVSSDDSKAESEQAVVVSQDGTVTAKQETSQPVQISLQLYRYGDNKMTNKLAEATCLVTVSGELSVDSIMIEPKTLTLSAPRTSEEAGGTATLLAALYPEDAPNRSVLWNIYNSEDRKYLRIDADGTVTARYYEAGSNGEERNLGRRSGGSGLHRDENNAQAKCLLWTAASGRGDGLHTVMEK